MLLFAILQLLAIRASILLPVAVIGLVTVPLVLVNVLTIDAPKPSTSMFSLDSIEAVMCSRQVENGLYVASAFVHPMAGKVLKNIVLPYVCGHPDALVPPTTPHNEGPPIRDSPRRNSSRIINPRASKHFQKYATKGVSRQIHPAFITLGLGLGVHASSSHTVSPILPSEDIQFGRGVRRSARLSPFHRHSDVLHPLYSSVHLPPLPRVKWLCIDTVLKATAFLALMLLAPFFDAPLARLECKMGLHAKSSPAKGRSCAPPSIVLDLLIPSNANGEPWSMLRAPEPLANRANVYTCMEGMSNMQPIYSKTVPSPEDFFLLVNRGLNTNLLFSAGKLPQLLRSVTMPPSARGGPGLHEPRIIPLPVTRTLELIEGPPACGLSPPPPSQERSVLCQKIIFHISAVQMPLLAYLGCFNSSQLRMTPNAIGLSIIFLPKLFILGGDIQCDIRGPVETLPPTSENNVEEARPHLSIPTPSINDTFEVPCEGTPFVEEASRNIVDDAPRIVSSATSLSTRRRIRKSKITSLLHREGRKRFFELWLRVGHDEKTPTMPPEAIAAAISEEEEDDGDEVFDYLSPTGLRQKSIAPTSYLNVDTSFTEQDMDKHDYDDDDDDDDEVFDYLSPTGLRQTTLTRDQSLTSLDESSLSCFTDCGVTSSSYPSIPYPSINDGISCNTGNFFAPESPDTTISLSRSESLETIHVLDVGGHKGYDTQALFEDDSDTIRVSLSSSSTLNQLSNTAPPSKAEQDAAHGFSRSTVVKLPPAASSSRPALDFLELFMSIYCKNQSVDRSLWSSIHAPGKANHIT